MKKEESINSLHELRERRADFKVHVIPAIIGVLSAGIKETIQEVKKIFKQGDLSKKMMR